MTKVINADPRIAVPLDEDEIRRFLTGSKSLLMHIGTNDARGEPNVIPIVYYFDEGSKKIYITTHNSSKKVESLKKKNTISFCIDDPNSPSKGVKGKGRVRIYEDINYIRIVSEKLLKKSIGSLEHPAARWLLNEIRLGNEVVLEIIPSYYSTWDYSKGDLM